MYPKAPLIKRNGEVNAWDNPDFKAAVEATGRKQIILGGIVTEVCQYLIQRAKNLTLTVLLQAPCFSPSPSVKQVIPSGPTPKPAARQPRNSPKTPTEEWKTPAYIWQVRPVSPVDYC